GVAYIVHQIGHLDESYSSLTAPGLIWSSAHQFMSLLEPREKQRDILPLEQVTG
ncbi:hypothetical protein KT99_00421, partial [Shewanella benthica KT99]